MLKNSGFLPLPIAVFAGRPLVVLLLAFCESDRELGSALVPVQVERYKRVALALDGTDEPIQFIAVQQQLAAAGRVRPHVRGRGLQRRKVGADQPGFAVA